MKKYEKWLIIILAVIAVGATATAIYFGTQDKEPVIVPEKATKEETKKPDEATEANKQELVVKNFTLEEYDKFVTDYFETYVSDDEDVLRTQLTIFNITDFKINNKLEGLQIIRSINSKSETELKVILGNQQIDIADKSLLVRVNSIENHLVIGLYNFMDYYPIEVYDLSGKKVYEINKYSNESESYQKYSVLSFGEKITLEESYGIDDDHYPLAGNQMPIKSLDKYCKGHYNTVNLLYELKYINKEFVIKEIKKECSFMEY